MTLRSSLTLAFAVLLRGVCVAKAQTDSSRSIPVAPLVCVPAHAWGAALSVIDSAAIAASTAPTLSELLQARRPGLRVFRSGGLVSDGALVMLRGPTTLIGPGSPIVIIDGVRVDSRQYDMPLGFGAMAPSRLDDLFSEDIARIEVLGGAAAALYGDGASNGVILVTTKSAEEVLSISAGVSRGARRRTKAIFPPTIDASGRRRVRTTRRELDSYRGGGR